MSATWWSPVQQLERNFKEHRALRTELVISDTRDFGIGRRVNADNWKALRAVGEAANRRLCDAQASDAVPAPDVVTFTQVTCPSDDPDGLHAPGLRFGDKRVMAVMSAVVGFGHLMAGFNNAQLTELVATLIDTPYTARQATYDFAGLRRKGLIERLPHSNRYQLTPLGRRRRRPFHQDLWAGTGTRARPARLGPTRRTRRTKPTCYCLAPSRPRP